MNQKERFIYTFCSVYIMHRKEYLIKLKPTGQQEYVFQIKDPKKEDIVLLPLGKYIRIEDEKSIFMIKNDYYKIFLDGNHTFKGHVSLSPKTMNIVQEAEVICPNYDCTKKKLKYVLKSGTNKRIEKEFKNYVDFHKIKGIHTLYPIGFVINKISSEIASSFHFTKLEENVIPLSAIDYKNILKAERMEYIKKCSETLAILHSNGYTHNDPKLKNFLLKHNNSLLIIDLVKTNYSTEQINFDINQSLSSPKMQAIRYDFLNFLGSAVYSNLITDYEDIELFIKSYLKIRSDSSQGKIIKKGKPHEINKFIVDLISAIQLHKTDKNIANIIKVLKGKEELNVDRTLSRSSYEDETPLFKFMTEKDFQ